MRLTVDVEGQGPLPPLPGDGAALVAVMSFAVSRGFGAQHPLIAFADVLHDKHRVRLGPLTTFYEAEPEDGEDREKLELSWQPAPELRESLSGLIAAYDADPSLQVFARRGAAGNVRCEAAALLDAITPAGDRRVRLGYTL